MPDFLRRTVEQLLGVPPADPGQGTAWRYSSSFPWPAWVTLLAILFTIVYVVGVYRRDAASLPRFVRWLLIALRLGATAAFLFFLSAAALSIERTGLPYIVVLLDVSGSMETPDQYADKALAQAAASLASGGSPTRLNLAKGLLTRREGEFLKLLQQRHKLRVYTFADGVAWLGNQDYLDPQELDELLTLVAGATASGDQTRPGPALRTALNELRGTPPTAVIVLTDGITTTTDSERLSAAADLARSKAIPVFTVGVGNEESPRDVQLLDLLVDDVAFVDDPIKFIARIGHTGFDGEKVEVTLKRAGQDKVLARETVPLQPGEPAKVEITYTPGEVGEFDFIVEVKPLPKEFRLDNNKETRRVTVSNKKIKVLLVESAPRYEFRYLKHLLQREIRSLEFKAVLQDADPEYADEDPFILPQLPVTKEELFTYDVVILGDVQLGLLSPTIQANLRDFVREGGGGVIFIAGPLHNPVSYRGTPLESLLPIELDGVRLPPAGALLSEEFRPQLTPEGLNATSIFRLEDGEADSREAWQKLPGWYWFVETPQLKPGALPLATHPTRSSPAGRLPVVVLQRFGAGKTLFHASDDTWRWRFRVGDRYFGRYWIQAIRYLSRSRLLGKDKAAELTVDRTTYRRGDAVLLRVRFLNDQLAPSASDGVTVVVERQGDQARRLKLTRVPQAPTVFEGQLANAAEGTYHAWVATPTFPDAPPSRDFRVESPLQETQTLRMDAADLRRTAERTNGRYYTLATAPTLLEDLPPGRPVPLKSDDPIRLWNHWLPLLLFVGLLATEWTVRKRWQLA